MLQFLNIRGKRRIYEKKKYKCLGEISTLTMILDEAQKRLVSRTIKKATEVVQTAIRNSSRAHFDFDIESSNSRENIAAKMVDTDAIEEKEENNSMIPSDDWFYQHIYKEFD